MPYVIDTNVFIEAKRRYYAFDLCPGFWNALCWQHGTGSVRSIDRVFKEVEDGADDLADWVRNVMPATCFDSTDTDDVAGAYAEAIAWVMGNANFTAAAKAEFADLNRADAWLIAYAKAKGDILVTHEELRPDARAKVPIPNVCNALGVQYSNTFEMLRALETRFSWQQPV
jgi:hypothetical protein